MNFASASLSLLWDVNDLALPMLEKKKLNDVKFSKQQNLVLSQLVKYIPSISNHRQPS